jgi:chromosome segregation ATPase
MISLIIAIILSALIIVGVYAYIKIMIKKAMSGSTNEITSQIKDLDKKLAILPKYVNSYGSKKQLESIITVKAKEAESLEKSKKELEQFEAKLNKAQVDIEQKENEQQDLKLNKGGDEDKLQELIANFTDLSSKSEDLESRLAQSMDNIDNMSAELKLSEEQEELMKKLSNALTSAGGLMRDLIGEQQAMQDRLSMLDGQHEDLEEEYTRLVEQQLGE